MAWMAVAAPENVVEPGTSMTYQVALSWPLGAARPRLAATASLLVSCISAALSTDSEQGATSFTC